MLAEKGQIEWNERKANLTKEILRHPRLHYADTLGSLLLTPVKHVSETVTQLESVINQ